MIIDITDFEEVGYASVQFQEVVVFTRKGIYYGPLSKWFLRKPEPYTVLAHRLCGNVFILTGDGESESVRLRQAMPTANFVYPTLHRPDDYSEFNGGYQPNVYELNARRRAPFRMSIDDQSTEEFKKVMRPYCDGRQFKMDDEVYMLMKMRF